MFKYIEISVFINIRIQGQFPIAIVILSEIIKKKFKFYQ